MRIMKANRATILLVFLMLAGFSLLLYPTVSSFLQDYVQANAVHAYIQQVSDMDDGAYTKHLDEAYAYNEELMRSSNPLLFGEAQMDRYHLILDIAGDGVMGYVEIPCIDVSLPIYHGTTEAVLQNGVGHIEWTSLPVGGISSHCVITGHRGLPASRLFRDLDKLVVGDWFVLHVLEETLTYEVDKIRVVEPHETDELLIQQGMDLCTLMTCTPYGINSHRLLVRGHRVDDIE